MRDLLFMRDLLLSKNLFKSVSFLSFFLVIIAFTFIVGMCDILGQIPRPEHPKPQFYRAAWLNLNGEWDFAFDFGVSGVEKGWPADPSGLDKKILVPFCPESKLSGIGYTDFIPAVWYHRTFSISKKWEGMRVFLHFGGVDYDCRAWVNGTPVGRHYGGSVSFTFEVTDALRDGVNNLVVCALDDTRSGTQPLGKQSSRLDPTGGSWSTSYTRTTGIWQTVWLEARPQRFIESVRVVPDLDNDRFVLTPVIKNYHRGLVFQATLYAEGEEVASARTSSGSGVPLALEIKEPRPWSPSDPHLYDLRFELLEGEGVVDVVNSYAGLRKFHIEGNRLYLNNKPIFMRLVLDQGFYPDGIWTAPSDKALKNDVVLSMAVGFNGARLHEKVFEERFHYWSDRLGYLTWGEYPNFGMDFGQPQAIHNQQREWREVVMRDLNHPSIVAWTPFNETSGGARSHFEAHRRGVQETVDLTRALDPTRPVNDASGYVHVDTDIYTVHNYQQDSEVFQKDYAGVAPDKREGFHINLPELSVPYAGQPFVVDEYGGTFWDEEEAGSAAGDRNTWGYGKGTKEQIENLAPRGRWISTSSPPSAGMIEEVIEKLTVVLTGHPHIAGYTYCQLTDVEGEINGIYTYDRKLKFNAERLKKILGAPAAIEKRKD